MRLPLLALLAGALLPVYAQTPPRQTQEDDYTKYELLAPGSAQFRIYYEVTATTPGARFFYNTIRPGSIATDERVIDLATGRPLRWEVVSGKEARVAGHPAADPGTDYIKVHLAAPVPAGGEARLLIDKTYTDAKSYYRDGDAIVFDRSLGIRRNTIVLPAGYRIVSCNVPSQVIPAADGRLQVSFMNFSAAAAPLVLRAQPGLAAFVPKLSAAEGPAVTAPLPSDAARLSERAHEDREIVYFLDDPASHTFTLHHDYTESRAGAARYVSLVRPGSRIAQVSAVALDTGRELKAEILPLEELQSGGGAAGMPAAPAGAQMVVVTFPAIGARESLRLRIRETYADPERYRLDGDELVWDRSLARPRNTVVLPAGWTVVASSIPGQISEDDDGRQRLYFENPRPDQMQVLIRARRRQ